MTDTVSRPLCVSTVKRDLIRQFTPNWFAATMGTGVVALILPQLPSVANLNTVLGQVLWLLNMALFVLFGLLYTARWLLYSDEARQIFTHPGMSLFLGTIPMGLATIINGFLKFGIPWWGDTALYIAQYLWYVDVVLSLATAICIPCLMFYRQNHALEQMTALWLLPVVTAEVAAASGGLLLAHLPADQHSVAILGIGYMLWGVSVLPAFAILTILFLRMALHKLPEKQLAISSWLALGPIGTGALALMTLGNQAPRILASIGLADVGVLCHHLAIPTVLILLGFGVWWLGVACFTTCTYLKTGLPFNLGWWGLTFPLGVYTLAITHLAAITHFHALNYLFDGFALVLCGLWLLVAVKTALGAYRGHLFFSPCLQQYLQQKQMQG